MEYNIEFGSPELVQACIGKLGNIKYKLDNQFMTLYSEEEFELAKKIINNCEDIKCVMLESKRSAKVSIPLATRVLNKLNESNNSEAIKVASDILRTLTSSTTSRGLQTQAPEIDGKSVVASIRYWGNWVVPEDEEDDGDYDWEVLDDKSRAKLEDITDKVTKQYPKFNIRITPAGEKNWINIEVSSK